MTSQGINVHYGKLKFEGPSAVDAVTCRDSDLWCMLVSAQQLDSGWFARTAARLHVV